MRAWSSIFARQMSSATLRRVEGALFLSPWIIGFFVFMAFPLCYSLYMSFMDVKVSATGFQYIPVGIRNYDYILFKNAAILYESLLPFLKEQLLIIPIIVIFALLIAILLNQKFKGRSFFRVVFFLPVIFSSGQIVREFIAQGQGGIGTEGGDFEAFMDLSVYMELLSNSWMAPIVTILNSFVLILWYSGVQILIFLAGRQSISGSVYEAARIDGANPWGVFWKITLPGMTPFILLNVIYTIVDLFTFPTNPILSQINNENIGQSSALAWIYFFFIFLILSIVYFIFHTLTKSQRSSNRS